MGVFNILWVDETGAVNTDPTVPNPVTPVGWKYSRDGGATYTDYMLRSNLGAETWQLNAGGVADQNASNAESVSRLGDVWTMTLDDVGFNAILTLVQTVVEDGATGLVTVTVEITNISGGSLTDIQYIRSYAAEQNANKDHITYTVVTDMTPGMAMKAADNDTPANIIALGSDDVGVRIDVLGTAGAIFDIPTAEATGYAAWNGATVTTSGTVVTKNGVANYATNLWWPKINLNNGESHTYTFYYSMEESAPPPPSTKYGLWKAYFKGFVSGEDMIAGAFGIPTEFEPTMGTNQVLIMQMDAVDINGWAAGLPGIFKLERDATDTRDDDTGDQSVLAIELIYDRV